MRLYLDTEFNGHGGELISMAIAAEDGRHWYEVLPEPAVWHPWCHEHVRPFLRKEPVTPEFFRASLKAYLQADSRCGSIIYADWPDDFAHLMRVMSGGSYEESWMVGCTMALLTESEPVPSTPHNALSDAIALMDWHQAKQK